MLKTRVPNVRYIGPASNHDQACAVCWVKPAVLFMNEGVFLPCWSCQEAGWKLKRSKSWKEILHQLVNYKGE